MGQSFGPVFRPAALDRRDLPQRKLLNDSFN